MARRLVSVELVSFAGWKIQFTISCDPQVQFECYKYFNFNLQGSPPLIGLTLSAEERPDGRLYVRLMAKRRELEPNLSVLRQLPGVSDIHVTR